MWINIFENWVLLQIFEPNRNEVRDCRTLPTELNYLYFLIYMILMTKVRKLREVRFVSIMEKGKVVYRLQVGNVKLRDNFRRGRRRWEDIIKRILNKWNGFS